MCIEDVLIQSLKEMKATKLQIQQINKETEVVKDTIKNTVTKLEEESQRISNLDCIDINGDERYKLNYLVRKYAREHKVTYQKAWHDFKENFNKAFNMNIESRKINYQKKNNIKNLSLPIYLEKVALIKDGLRVADKMLNSHKILIA